MPRRLIVGLGNPGRQYLRTRHNLGFWVLDELADKLEVSWKKVLCKSATAQARYDTFELTLVKPVTYMNLSGKSIQCFMQSHRFTQEDLLIVCDDVNLPVGKIRIRPHGSAGGHHGLESIIESIGSHEFCRIRLGVKPLEGDLPEDLSEFVLQPFRKGEEAIVSQTVRKAVNAIFVMLEENIEAAMNRFNR